MRLCTFFSTLARKLKTSVEESPRENLDGKSIARATSCFVENAKTHNAFPQNSFLARADFRKESFARARYQAFQRARAAKSSCVEEGLTQEKACARIQKKEHMLLFSQTI